MNATRRWIANRTVGQFLLVSAPLLMGSCGAAEAAFSRWRADRQACAEAKVFADSLASNRTRLAAVDDVLARFDLEQNALPDTGAPAGAPNRLERRIIALRREGVTAAQLERWLRDDMRRPARAIGAAGSLADSAQVAQIHAYERDTSYVGYLHKNFQITYDYWHDMAVLSPLAERWQARCSAYRSGMKTALPVWAVATSLLFLVGGWWFGARRNG